MVTDSAGHSPVSRCIEFMRSMIADHEMAIQRHLREIEELESNDAAEFADRTAPFSASRTPNVTNGDTRMNENTTPMANASSEWVQQNFDLSPRENVLDYIGHRLCEARDHSGTGIFDVPQVAMEILEFIEARAKAIHPDGWLAFVNPDFPVQMLES